MFDHWTKARKIRWNRKNSVAKQCKMTRIIHAPNNHSGTSLGLLTGTGAVKDDQREKATLHQPIPRLAVNQTPEEQPVEEKDQQAFPDTKEVVSLYRNHAKNTSAPRSWCVVANPE